MALHLHRAERADALVQGLAEILAVPPGDVLAEEVVAVPARGIERWITQRLSHRLGASPDSAGSPGEASGDGVCAGVRFPSPAGLLAEVVGVRDADPWAPDRLVWPLLDTLDDAMGEPWCTTVSEHLGQGSTARQDQVDRRGRRYAVSRKLAGLFDSYAMHRPDMLRRWTAGTDSDADGSPLPPDLVWQAELWRRVASRIPGPDPLQRIDNALQRLADDPASIALPERLSLFGATRLPSSFRNVLVALSHSREVHLWLPHPSAALWDRLTAARPEPLAGTVRSVRRAQDPTATVAHHPLTASLGRESRELQLSLPRVANDRHRAVPVRTSTVLQRLQRDIAGDQVSPPVTADPSDRSVAIHACHGPARQVEVLRESLVHALADDPTLEPRDIVVMCPDIETYAPLIAAAFGLEDVAPQGHPGHQLRVRLADRSRRRTNPLLALAIRLLNLAGGRLTASEVLDLAALPVVRRRFRFADDDLETIAGWVARSGTRWGLDAEHRAAFDLQQFPQNTWRAGLDRILVGVAMADENQNKLGTALPLDEIGSSSIDLAGRLAELVQRLGVATDALTGEVTLAAWITALRDGVRALAAVSEGDSWQEAELDRQWASILDDAGASAGRVHLRRSDVLRLLELRFASRPTRANFRTGTLTVCTLVPMRSVPHRLVCLLGLDDGVFPRGAGIDGDDILARDPMVGERDPRAEDRQLLLDAVMAATDRLVITYTGADERTGAVKPPAVPLGELIDVLDRAAGRTAETGSVVVRHPLQPYSSRSVTPGELGIPEPFSFDPAALAGARASGRRKPLAEPPLAEALPPLDPGDVDLGMLVEVLRHPVRGFLRYRLKVAFEEQPAEFVVNDSIPVEVAPLEQRNLGDRLLAQILAGTDPRDARNAELLRGSVPPVNLGRDVLVKISDRAAALAEAARRFRLRERRTVDIAVPVSAGGMLRGTVFVGRELRGTVFAGREVRGTVSDVFGDRLLSVGYARLSAGQRLRAWIRLLAASATGAEPNLAAVTIGRSPAKRVDRLQQSVIGPVKADVARQELSNLVTIFDAALCEPLPCPAGPAEAYADARGRGMDVPNAEEHAAAVWDQDPALPDAAYDWVLGEHAPFAAVLDGVNTSGITREATRFGDLAVRIWEPLLAHEQLEWL